MVAIRHDMKDVSKSSFVRLANGYIANTKKKTDRVLETRIENSICKDDIWMASKEAEKTQLKNTTSNSDKTYHLVVSFRPGEDPPMDVMRKIQEQYVKALGFEEHAWVAAIHGDTSNKHMHIAINKIHPKTFNIHEPYRDLYTLGETSAELEKKFSLEPDPHDFGRKTKGERRAKDMEANTGQESFITFMKRECNDVLHSAQSWAELHKGLAEFGIEAKLRGNGMVFTSHDGISVTASSIGREFSKDKLCARFGIFECPNDSPAPDSEKVYKKEPIGESKKSQLRMDFEADQEVRQEQRGAALAFARATYDLGKKQLIVEYRKECAAIAGQSSYKVKNELYKTAAERHKRKKQKLYDQFKVAKSGVYESKRKLNWLSWLQKQAENGREDALNSLRARAYGLAKSKTGVSGRNIVDDTMQPGNVDYVTKNGTIVYRVGNDGLRDDGAKFTVTRESTQETAVMALRMAQKRYGDNLTLTGDSAFKEKMVNAAVSSKMRVTFTDPDLEALRKKLMNTPKQTQSEQQRRKGVKRS